MKQTTQNQTTQSQHDSRHPSLKNSSFATKVAAGGAAAAAVGAVVYRAFSNGDNAAYEIKIHEDGWQLVKDGRSRATGVYSTKKEAVSAGRDLAAKKAPSTLRIYNTDGELGDSHSYDPEDES